MRSTILCVACCRDDLAWAAAWLYRETGDNAYLSDAYFFYSQHQTQEGDYDKRYLVRLQGDPVSRWAAEQPACLA